MKLMKAVLAGAVALGLAPVCLAEEAAAAKKPMMKKEATVWPAGNINWVESPTMKGVSQAVLWGDPAKGSYGALHKWAAGTQMPAHWHTFSSKVVVVAGTLSVSIDGGPTQDLGPGSYSMIPGRLKHSAVCKGRTDCVYFAEQPGRSDIKMVEAASAKK